MAYWYTDGDRQYNGWRLDEKSRDIAALWTPLGLLRPTRLQFGLMNAGIVTQGRLRVMRQQKLSVYTREHSENIADDFTGWTDHRFDKGKPIVDWDGLATGCIEHLARAHAENMSFKAKKTVFGAPSGEFWGHTLDVEGSRQADHNMAPLERMVAPKDQSELRRVLGVLVQHKDAIDRGGIIAAPLYRLTGKVPWVWGATEEAAFEQLRSNALKNNVLAPFDPKKQVRVRVDASDDGKGWMIYQLCDADGEDEPQNRAVLRYGSKAWNRSMRSRPPYYKEADGLITAATDARYYAEATAFPLLLFTDHAPLQYIKTCAKGPVTGDRLAHRELDGNALRGEVPTRPEKHRGRRAVALPHVGATPA